MKPQPRAEVQYLQLDNRNGSQNAVNLIILQSSSQPATHFYATTEPTPETLEMALHVFM